MICVSEWPLPGTVIDVESGSGRRSLGGLWDCYITWIGLDLSNDLIVGGKWDTVAGKSPNLMGDGEEQRDSTRARPTPRKQTRAADQRKTVCLTASQTAATTTYV